MAQAERTNRLRNLGLLALLGIIIIAGLAYWFVFRDTSAASVDSDEAAAARQEAIESAASDNSDSSDGATDTNADAPSSDEGQPDAAASVGSPVDGTWTVDTTIGTFDDACLEVACSSTFVGFRINEELAGFGAKTVVGRTPGVTGSIEVSGTQIVAADFTADMTQLITDNASRTDALRGRSGGLETDTFPEARFVLTQPIELGQTPVEGAEVTATAVGDLTVHGVTNQVSIPLTAELQAGLVVIFGTLPDMVLADYDIPKPEAVVVLGVEDVAAMELQLFLSRG